MSLELKIPPPIVAVAIGVLMWLIARLTPAFAIAIPASRVLAGAIVALGVLISIAGVRSFRKARTTLNPLSPKSATSLVDSGIYRFTRNPMYNGVLVVLIGEAWLFRSQSLWKYAALIFVMFHVMVTAYEEPTLESEFGESFRIYKRAVPRWGFARRPFTPSPSFVERT